MRYFIRAVKYFVHITFILALILAALVLLHLVEADPQKMFVDGMTSVWKIAALMVVFSAIYPRFGYSKREIDMKGDYADVIPELKKKMEARGYRVEKEDDEIITFRLTSPIMKFTRLWEDRLTFTRHLGGFILEGATKDITRIATYLNTNSACTPE